LKEAKMYYRIAIQRERDQLDQPPTWQWKSSALSSLESLFQVLRLYSALPQEHLRVFSSLSREGLEEQLRQENSGPGSSSVTAAQFLQQRMIHSKGATPAGGSQGREGVTSIAITSRTRLDESAIAARALHEWSMSSLEKRRLEQELGTGGDHDVPYHFALPLSMPQVLTWTKLMGRVQRGEVEP
jgi:hypothetical protein